MVEELFIRNGFKKDSERNYYYHPLLPFELYEENGYLKIMINSGEYYLDNNKIFFSEMNIKNLIKAFNP